MHTVVKELQDEARDARSTLNVRGAPKRQELMLLIKNLEAALSEVDVIVQKYQGLGRRDRKIWNQLKFATEHLDPVRGKLTVHLTAINVFTDSLSRGNLAQIETVLLELVREVREGRRPPSIVTNDARDEQSVWRELESELAEDGISKEDVAKHKTAIKVFLHSLLSDIPAETMSLDEVASIVESNNGQIDSEPLLQRMTQDSRVSTMGSVDQASFISADSEQYESAVEEFANQDNTRNSAPRISFAQHTRFPNRPKEQPDHEQGIDKRLQYMPTRRTSAGSIYRYRHSLDASIVDLKTAEQAQNAIAQSGSPQNRRMVLIIDPTHSSASKLAHAFLRSLVTSYPIVREHVYTVRSTAWQEHESGGMDSLGLDTLMRELLTRQKIDIPRWEKQMRFAPFQLRDVIEFDHIIYFNSPSFRQVLEDHIDTIATLKEKYGVANRPLARLTRYDLPPSSQIPESMDEFPSNKAVIRNRQKLALEEIFKMVQWRILRFLEQECGLKRTSQGFDKILSRRPSRSSPLSLERHEARSDLPH